MVITTLTAGGFAHYEISNYARPGHESRHNLAYWQGRDYLGFGPSAFSTVGLRRWKAVPDTAEYVRRINARESVVAFEENLTPVQRRGEMAAFGMRMAQGLPLAEIAPWRTELEKFRELGFTEESDSHLRLTRRGKLMADAVAETFV